MVTGVIQNERTLVEMFTEFVLLPLWTHAEKSDVEEASAVSAGNESALGEPLAGAMNLESLKSMTGSPTVVGAVALGLTVATIGAYLVMRPRSTRVA